MSVHVDIKAIGGRLTLFQTTLCDIFPWKSLASLDILDPQNYLDAYNAEDIQLICCQPDASTLWLVPPVAQNRYIRSLGQMELMLTWIFLRARPKGKESVKYESPVDNCPSMDDVAQVLNGTANSFRIIDAYPRYFRVTGSGEVRRLDTTVYSRIPMIAFNYYYHFKWFSYFTQHF